MARRSVCAIVATVLAFCIKANAQTIYYPDNSSVLLKKVAEDVATLFQKSGATPMPVTQAYAQFPSSGIQFIYDSTITDNELCKVTGNNQLLQLRAREDNGLIAGIYRYLHQLGFRFYQPGSLWEKIPSLNTVYKNIDTIYSSRYKYRTWFASGGHRLWAMDKTTSYNWEANYIGENGNAWASFMRRNAMTGAHRFSGHRNDIMTTDYVANLQNNPCQVASYFGSRAAGKTSVADINNMQAKQNWANAIEAVFTQKQNVILGNPQLYKDLYRSLQYSNRYIGIEVPDGAKWAVGTDNSSCASNVKISAATQAALLANYTASSIRVKYPEKQFQMYAYFRHADVPAADVKLHNYIDVQVPQAYQVETSVKGMYNRWYNRHSNVSEYHYLNLAAWSGETPDFSYESFKQTAARLQQAGSQGIVTEASPAKFASLPLLRSLNEELLNGVAIDKSLTEFCDDMFGPASPKLMELLIKMGDKDIVRSGSYRLNNRFVFPELFKHLKEADLLANTADEKVKQRIAELKAYMHYWVLYHNYAFTENATAAQKRDRAGELCIYLAKINKLQLVNSYYLINNIVTANKNDEVFTSLYNAASGSAYQNGNLSLLSAAEIENNYQADLSRYGTTEIQPAFKKLEVVQSLMQGKFSPAKKIDVSIAYTNGDAYYNRLQYSFYAPAAGSFNIKYVRKSEMEDMSQLNFLVEHAIDALNIIKDFTVTNTSAAGQVTINVPAKGYYLLTVTSKYKTSVTMQIQTGNNWFFKKETFLGNISESYAANPADFPGNFYIPQGLQKLYFSISNAYTPSAGYLKASALSQKIVFKNSKGILVYPIMSATDSLLYYIDVPAVEQGTVWQLKTIDNRLQMAFVNISNIFWYGNQPPCEAAKFTVSTVKIGDECATKLTATKYNGSNRWEISDMGKYTYYENLKELLLPLNISPGAVVTLNSSATCFATQRLADIEGYLQMRENCTPAAVLPEDETLQLSPNPSTGILNVLANGRQTKVDMVEFYNANGRKVASFANKATVNVSHLSAAFYWYKLKTNNSYQTGKLVKL